MAPLSTTVLHRAVGGVVAAHEADLDQPPAEGHLGVDDPQAGLLGGRQRLLAEDRLAGVDARQHVLLVRRPPGADDHRVDPVSAISSWPVAKTARPGTSGHAPRRWSRSTSVTATTSTPASTLVSRRMWSWPIIPTPMTPTRRSCCFLLMPRATACGAPVLVDVALHLAAHEAGGLVRAAPPRRRRRRS